VAGEMTIATQLPLGWHGNDEDSRTDLRVGDLSMLLRQHIGCRLRFNVLQKRIELAGVVIPPANVELLHVDLSECGYQVRKEIAVDALRRVALDNQYNPVQEYLETIESDQSVQAIELNRVASDYLGTSDPLYDSMLAATLVGAVARTFEPGCKVDTCLVLKGGQGIGKSTVIKVLASPAWLNDTSQPKEKETLQAIHSCWIMELAELDSLTGKRESGAVKALLSSSVDKYQPPYGRAIEECPRRSIMIGTCNRDDFLRDETGSRRFWVIDLHHDFASRSVIDVNRLRQDRDRIWKAAVLAYRSGRKPVLSWEEQNESNRRNRRFEQEHPWTEPIATWLHMNTPQAFTTAECLVKSGLRICGENITQRDLQDASKVLHSLGYARTEHQQRKHGNKRVWLPASGASPPEENPEAPAIPAVAGDFADPPHVSPPSLKKEEKEVGGLARSTRCDAAKKGEAGEADGQILWRTGVLTPQANDEARVFSEADLRRMLEEACAMWE
jgi:predicted P-loop ATPase